MNIIAADKLKIEDVAIIEVGVKIEVDARVKTKVRVEIEVEVAVEVRVVLGIKVGVADVRPRSKTLHMVTLDACQRDTCINAFIPYKQSLIGTAWKR